MKTKLIFWGSMLFLLSLSILLTIYLAWIFYPLEIKWFSLTDRVYLKPETIQYNFHVLMNYLTNPFSQVLQMSDFRSSAAGLHHFAVVKNLFHLVQLVALVTLPSFYFFVNKIVKKGFLSLYRKSLLALVVLPLLIGLGGVLIGFDQFFTLFHQILFVGDDTWLFDPAKDPVILILPETFFLHAFLLSLSILLTIYLAWIFYPLEIQWLNLTNRVYLKPETIQYNFHILMNYLTNPFSQVLDMPDFRSSAAGLHHFAVVKNLFHLVQLVALVTLPSFYFFVKGIVKKGFLSLFSKGLLTLVVLPLLIGLGGVLIGFDQFFTLFHQILFVGDDTWLFDPAKDPVILILPETFFLHAFLLFFALYESFFGYLYLKSRRK